MESCGVGVFYLDSCVLACGSVYDSYGEERDSASLEKISFAGNSFNVERIDWNVGIMFRFIAETCLFFLKQNIFYFCRMSMNRKDSKSETNWES